MFLTQTIPIALLCGVHAALAFDLIPLSQSQTGSYRVSSLKDLGRSAHEHRTPQANVRIVEPRLLQRRDGYILRRLERRAGEMPFVFGHGRGGAGRKGSERKGATRESAGREGSSRRGSGQEGSGIVGPMREGSGATSQQSIEQLLGIGQSVLGPPTYNARGDKKTKSLNAQYDNFAKEFENMPKEKQDRTRRRMDRDNAKGYSASGREDSLERYKSDLPDKYEKLEISRNKRPQQKEQAAKADEERQRKWREELQRFQEMEDTKLAEEQARRDEAEKKAAKKAAKKARQNARQGSQGGTP